jgi:hypothetical protein
MPRSSSTGASPSCGSATSRAITSSATMPTPSACPRRRCPRRWPRDRPADQGADHRPGDARGRAAAALHRSRRRRDRVPGRLRRSDATARGRWSSSTRITPPGPPDDTPACITTRSCTPPAPSWRAPPRGWRRRERRSRAPPTTGPTRPSTSPMPTGTGSSWPSTARVRSGPPTSATPTARRHWTSTRCWPRSAARRPPRLRARGCAWATRICTSATSTGRWRSIAT